MDMYQKRKMRAEKKKNNAEENATKVSLNWFPRTYEQNIKANRK